MSSPPTFLVYHYCRVGGPVQLSFKKQKQVRTGKNPTPLLNCTVSLESQEELGFSVLVSCRHN